MDSETMDNKTELAELQDDLTLRMWEGDDSAKGELLVRWGGRVEKAIRHAFPSLTAEDAEDVVGEAIQRFWVWREKYDPQQSSIGSRLYWLAEKVAMEFRSGRLKQHRARIKERGVDAEFFSQIEAPVPDDKPPDETEEPQSPLQTALKDCFDSLSELQQDILRAYSESGDYPLEAATLGKELGEKHKGGVPIPAGTIRTNKSRAWDSIEKCMKRKNYDLAAMGYSDD